jgi:hypothetical protein
MIGTRRANEIRVLALAVFVSRTLDGRSVAIAERQWFTALPDRVNLVVERVPMSGGERGVTKHVLAITGRDLH